MTPLASTVTTRNIASVQTRGREVDQTASARALAYALFSKLMSSPFEHQEILEEIFATGELPELFAGLQETLPYTARFTKLIEVLQGVTRQDVSNLQGTYSSLFEVGNDGPPVPLRAELVRVGASKTKEELIRFYNYFSYDLQDQMAWAPDHISIQLEFMQVLCLREAGRVDPLDASFERAQLDFLDRHIVCWLPVPVGRLVESKPEGFYTIVMTALWDFLEQDRLWNIQTVTPIQEEE